MQNSLISYFPKEELKKATELFRRSQSATFSGAGTSSSKALILADILRDEKKDVKNVLWIVSERADVLSTKKALEVWSDRPVFTYARRRKEEAIKFQNNQEFEDKKRLELMEFVLRIFLNKKAIFVVDFESILQNFPNLEFIKKEKFSIKVGEKLDSVQFIQDVISLGYEATEDDVLKKGEYYRVGESLFIHPINSEEVVRIETAFDVVEKIYKVDADQYSKNIKELKSLDVYPLEFSVENDDIVGLFEGKGLIIDDEVDVIDNYYDVWNSFLEEATKQCLSLSFTSFNDDVKNHMHLHFLSILKYRNAYDLANDLRDKISAEWKTLFFTKNPAEVKGLLNDQKIPFLEGLDKENYSQASVFLIEVDKEEVFPQSFQNPDLKILLLTDTELSLVRDEKKRRSTVSSNRAVFADFLMSLKLGDYVVHVDHGIAKFMGLEQKTVDEVTKEYLKLGYAENDKLFVPIDQADKVNKYIGSQELMPRLTRLGSAEWNTLTKRVKKETQKIAKELLKLYAERKAAKGYKFKKDDSIQNKFEETFPYDETPGQIKAIQDTKMDMESTIVMDRLVCGDVGFGKTEVAMRATFKAVQSKKQVAVISPITILADQHYKSFSKRMSEFHVRVEMLSRFRTQKEQRQIVEKLKKGEIDVIIGTHRLLQKDIDFKNLGLVIIDEEQRFGVRQKEALKEIRKEVDMLTLTATPIPRTLNICLNKLRDVTTITTPPFGRLPVITEVRKYSASLVREVILREIDRGGQVYFLHNRVQTIDSFAQKMQDLVPEAKFIVAHGKLGSGDLEERIVAFKEKKYDVLVSSTIIENGIDLPNANTLIVDGAERFGLAQLYQLRGRVGRGKVQAYAYFLYAGQRLKLDAKKRLRAIVEASKLGSGFQIAMKDLEIRGAGDILGVNQHGVINVVGVAHFIRMLNKTVEDLRTGRILEGEEDIVDVSIELPIPAYIPDSYIVSSDDKINAYQRLSSADSAGYLKEIKNDLVEDHGKIPRELNNLFRIIEIKISAKKAHLVAITSEVMPMSKDREVVVLMSKKVKPGNIANLLEQNPKWKIVGSRLRINVKDLGYSWFDGLKKSVEALTVSKKPGKKA
ncbi:transcription-repair coupling factor [Patescibacteria group bacterium]